MKKITAKSIELTRAVGLIELCGTVTITAAENPWVMADTILKAWAATIPEEQLGYDKCDFTVTYADGNTYTGRYDLRRHDTQFPELLAYHMRRVVEFWAGLRQPAHMTAEDYSYLLTEHADINTYYTAFRDAYAIGAETMTEEIPA